MRKFGKCQHSHALIHHIHHSTSRPVRDFPGCFQQPLAVPWFCALPRWTNWPLTSDFWCIHGTRSSGDPWSSMATFVATATTLPAFNGEAGATGTGKAQAGDESMGSSKSRFTQCPQTSWISHAITVKFQKINRHDIKGIMIGSYCIGSRFVLVSAFMSSFGQVSGASCWGGNRQAWQFDVWTLVDFGIYRETSYDICIHIILITHNYIFVYYIHHNPCRSFLDHRNDGLALWILQ